jgi:hypothetical protein
LPDRSTMPADDVNLACTTSPGWEGAARNDGAQFMARAKAAAAPAAATHLEMLLMLAITTASPSATRDPYAPLWGRKIQMLCVGLAP